MNEHIRLLSLAGRFLDAAKDLSTKGRQGLGFPVPHYLTGHAIELALKAHLADRGADEEALRKIRHNLKTALGRADATVNAVLTDEQRSASLEFNPYYSGKELEYTAWGQAGRMIRVPDVFYLLDAATNLVRHLDRAFRAVRAKGTGITP